MVQFGRRGTEKVWRAGGEEYSKYKQQLVEMLKAGQLVVQMLAAEETISMPDGSRKATFTQETWDMVSLKLHKPCLVLLRELEICHISHLLLPPPLDAVFIEILTIWDMLAPIGGRQTPTM